MTAEFKVGDRVRLKVRPEIEGTVEDTIVNVCGSMRFSVTGEVAEAAGACEGWWVHRYPEEIELCPMAPEDYVGKTVTWGTGVTAYKCLAVVSHKGETHLVLGAGWGSAKGWSLDDLPKLRVVS